MTETVLVTGGTGFLGSHVAKALVDAGHDPHLFDVSTDESRLQRLGVAEDVTVRRGDVTDATSVFRAVRDSGATRIVHLAAVLLDTARAAPRTAIDVNIDGTYNVFEAARVFDGQVDRVAWASSDSVYSRPEAYPAGELLDEDSCADPATLYGATKSFCERLAAVYHEDHGVSVVGLRPQIIYGPGRERGASTVVTEMIERSAVGEPITVEYGDQVIDWHFVEDVADAFRRAAFVAPERLTRRVYTLAGTPATVRETAELVTALVPAADVTVSNEGTLPFTANHDMSRARADLGYEPEHALEDGLRKYIDVIRTDEGLPPLS